MDLFRYVTACRNDHHYANLSPWYSPAFARCFPFKVNLTFWQLLSKLSKSTSTQNIGAGKFDRSQLAPGTSLLVTTHTITCRTMDISLYGLLDQRTFSPTDILHHWHLPAADIAPRGHCAQQTFRHTDILSHLHFATRTFHPKDISPHRKLAPRATRPVDNSHCGQLALWTTRSMNNSPHDNLHLGHFAPTEISSYGISSTNILPFGYLVPSD